MNIEYGDIITLSDNKEYIVVRKIVLDGVNYYYISNTEDMMLVKFVYEKDGKLHEIKDEKLLSRVVEEFLQTIDFKKLLNK